MTLTEVLPREAQRHILVFCSPAECWLFGRTCRAAHDLAHPMVPELFRRDFARALERVSDESDVDRYMQRYFPYNLPLGAQITFTGSLVLSTLLGETWKHQDADCFIQVPLSGADQVDVARAVAMARLHGNDAEDQGPAQGDDSIVRFPWRGCQYTHRAGYGVAFKAECDTLVCYRAKGKKLGDFVLSGKPTAEILAEFDIRACACSWDPATNTLIIPAPMETLLKVSAFDNVKQFKRLLRYKRRGFELYPDTRRYRINKWEDYETEVAKRSSVRELYGYLERLERPDALDRDLDAEFRKRIWGLDD